MTEADARMLGYDPNQTLQNVRSADSIVICNALLHTVIHEALAVLM